MRGYIRKTNRVYGALTGLVRKALARRASVTSRSFLPAMTLNQASSVLWELKQRGEARMVRHNRQGRGGFGAVYAKTRQP